MIAKIHIKYLCILCFIVCAMQVQGVSQPYTKVYYQDSVSAFGVLSNGLHYSIKQNMKPKGDLYISLVVRAGFISEKEDKLLDVAHVLEHLMFRRTEHFPMSSSFRNKAQDVGFTYSATTDMSETEYCFNLSAYSDSALRTVLLRVQDWINHKLIIDSIELERERKVILNESEIYQKQRVNDPAHLAAYNNSEYAKRHYYDNYQKYIYSDLQLSKDDIMNFYHKYYTLPNMAIVMVGDIEIDSLKNLVEVYFGSVLPDSTAKRNEMPLVEPIKKMRFVNSTQETPNVHLIYDFPYKHSGNPLFYRKEKLYSKWLQAILHGRLCRNCASFHNVYAGTSTTAWQLQKMHIHGETADSVDVLLQCIWKTIAQYAKYGLTENEFKFFRTAYEPIEMSSHEQKKEFVSKFMYGDTLYYTDNQIRKFDSTSLNEISLNKINIFLKKLYRSEHQTVILSGYDKTKKKFYRKMYQQIWGNTLKPYVETKRQIDTAILELPTLSNRSTDSLYWQVVDSSLNIYTSLLSNGLKVTFLHSDIDTDKINVHAIKNQGLAAHDTTYMDKYFASLLQSLTGFGPYKKEDLERNINTKGFSFDFEAGISYYTGIVSESPLAKVQAHFQLYHALFTQPPYFDSIQWELMRQSQKLGAATNAMSEINRLCDTVYAVCSDDNPMFSYVITEQQLAILDKPTELLSHFEIFTNPFDFDFYIKGNIDKDSLLILLETYLGSLPNKKYKEVCLKPETSFVPQQSTHIEIRDTSASNSSVLIIYRSHVEDVREREALHCFSHILRSRMESNVMHNQRVYHMAVGMKEYDYPKPSVIELFTMFYSLEEMMDSTTNMCFSVLKSLLEDGVTEQEVQIAKAYSGKKWEEKLDRQSHLMRNIQSMCISGKNKEDYIWNIENWHNKTADLDAQEVMRIAKKHFGNSVYTCGKFRNK